MELGLVGCGAWGRLVLRDLVQLGCGVSVVARSQASRARAREGGASMVVGDVAELPTVDGIVVVAPTAVRPAILRTLLAREVPVFTEKPLAADATVADELARDAGDRLFVMDKWRHHAGIKLLGRIARSGELGRVHRLECRRVGWGNPHADVDAVWNLAPHDLAIAQEVLGTLPVPRFALAEPGDGAATGLIAVLGTDPTTVIEVSASNPDRRREVRLGCAEGVALLGHDVSEVLLWRHDESAPSRQSARGEPPLLAELRSFVGHLRGGPPPATSAREAAAAVRTLAQLRRLAGLEA